MRWVGDETCSRLPYAPTWRAAREEDDYVLMMIYMYMDKREEGNLDNIIIY